MGEPRIQWLGSGQCVDCPHGYTCREVDIPQSCTRRGADPSLAPRCRPLSTYQLGNRATSLCSHPALAHWEHPLPSPLGPVSCDFTEFYGLHPALCKPLSLGLMEQDKERCYAVYRRHPEQPEGDAGEGGDAWLGGLSCHRVILKRDVRTVLHRGF